MADPIPGAEVPAAQDTQRPALTPEAQRALAEADVRRELRDAAAFVPPAEVGGRSGPDPARYGDWEQGGIASDF